jgi:hypothetical protein
VIPALDLARGEFFANALPEWIGKYDDQGDTLVWGYHMFVRDWGEVLMRNPDKIQEYFAKVLDKQSFWNTKSTSNELVDVKTAEGATAIQQLLKPHGDTRLAVIRCQPLLLRFRAKIPYRGAMYQEAITSRMYSTTKTGKRVEVYSQLQG